jgi:hypothetical protein
MSHSSRIAIPTVADDRAADASSGGSNDSGGYGGSADDGSGGSDGYATARSSDDAYNGPV